MTAQLAPLPLEIRLRALEARVRGVPATTLADAETETSRQKRSDNDEQPLTRRVAALRAKLDDAANTSPPIKQFLDNYDQYAPLMRSFPETEEEAAQTSAIAADLLPLPAKTALVLEARADIVAAEKGLRDIDVYNRRGVAGADNLQEIVDLKPALKAGMERVASRQKDLATKRAEVASLVQRYTDFTTTVSDMFLELHEQVSQLEETVARAERTKREELKQRY